MKIRSSVNLIHARNYLVNTYRYDFNAKEQQPELGLGLTSSTLILFGATAPIGIGIGIIDLSGGFDGFYNHLNQQEKFYQSTGGIMVPTTGIPTFIRLKKKLK